MAADLRLMEKLAKLLEFEFPELETLRPDEIVRQFGLSIRREMNFVNECRNTDRMAAIFLHDPMIVIPKIYWEYASERVSVQDYIEGITGLDEAAIKAAGLDRRKLAKVGADAVLRMILLEGFFHADPHNGNLLYLPGNRIAFIDFGMVGRLSAARRNQLVDLLYAIVEREPVGAADVLLEWSGSPHVDPDRLAVDMDSFIDRYHGAPLKHISLTMMLADLTQLMRQHYLALPPDLSLLFRALVALDGMGRQNDPEFDIFSQTTPFLLQALKARFEPAAVSKRGWRNVVQLVDIFANMPSELRRMLRAAHQGTLRFNIHLTRLDHFGWQVERAASWLTVGLITAALIVGSSIVMTVGGGPALLGLPAFGLIGYLGAAVGALWLLVSIWKSTHGRGRSRF